MCRFNFFILFLLFSSFSQVQAENITNTGTEVGRYAPPIELADLSGKIVSLASLRGSVVLLNFWSTLSSPCVAEMPSLNRLYTALKENGLQVVSVAIDPTDQPVREYVSKNNIAFTVLLDKDKDFFFARYAGPPLPVTYLIDQDGVIVEKFTGLEVWDAPEMKNRILMILEKNKIVGNMYRKR